MGNPLQLNGFELYFARFYCVLFRNPCVILNTRTCYLIYIELYLLFGRHFSPYRSLRPSLPLTGCGGVEIVPGAMAACVAGHDRHHARRSGSFSRRSSIRPESVRHRIPSPSHPLGHARVCRDAGLSQASDYRRRFAPAHGGGWNRLRMDGIRRPPVTRFLLRHSAEIFVGLTFWALVAIWRNYLSNHVEPHTLDLHIHGATVLGWCALVVADGTSSPSNGQPGMGGLAGRRTCWFR